MLSSIIFYYTYSDVFLEKHWRSVIPRSVCDYYLEAQRASPNVSIKQHRLDYITYILIYILIFL